MLEIAGLHTYYALSHILHGVDLSVGAGEIVALFGRNGVGKTTIIKTVAGWVKPRSGSIRLDGEEIGGVAPDVIARKGIGLVPEDRRIFPGLTVEENLRLGFQQRARKPTREERRATLESVYYHFPRLRERHAQMATTLSGGEQQMLAMARILMGTPRLALIDEPTEGLAPQIVGEIVSIIRELKARKISILLVEQNVEVAFSLADRFYFIERGTVRLEGVPSSAEDRRRAIEAFEL